MARVSLSNWFEPGHLDTKRITIAKNLLAVYKQNKDDQISENEEDYESDEKDTSDIEVVDSDLPSTSSGKRRKKPTIEQINKHKSESSQTINFYVDKSDDENEGTNLALNFFRHTRQNQSIPSSTSKLRYEYLYSDNSNFEQNSDPNAAKDSNCLLDFINLDGSLSNDKQIDEFKMEEFKESENDQRESVGEKLTEESTEKVEPSSSTSLIEFNRFENAFELDESMNMFHSLDATNQFPIEDPSTSLEISGKDAKYLNDDYEGLIDLSNDDEE